MRRILWIFAWAAVAVWSLIAFVAHSLVDWLGWTTRVTTREVPGFMPEPDSFAALFSILHQTGLSAVVLGWFVVASLILGGAWLVDSLVLRRLR